MKQAACPICGEDSDPKLDLSPSPFAAQIFSVSPRAGVRDGFECFRVHGDVSTYFCVVNLSNITGRLFVQHLLAKP